MYSFAQRPDTTVVDEPLYAYYLAHSPSDTEHPMREAILGSQSSDGPTVVREVLLGSDYPTSVVVFKQMTHHLLDLDRTFLAECHNVLLIRDPRAILASYSKVIATPDLYDVGIVQQHDLYRYLQSINALSAVVDTALLLQHPPSVLRALSRALDLPFDDGMLQWSAGPRPEDGVWAPHWYANVHQSTGFAPYRPKTYELSDRLEALAAQARPIYERLLQEAIQPEVGG